MCNAADVRQALARAGLKPMARGEGTPGRLARRMNRGRDNTVRQLLASEYGIDPPTAYRIVEALQARVAAMELTNRRVEMVIAVTVAEDRANVITIRMPRAGETWLQAGYSEDTQGLFVVSMEVAARYRRNGLSTALLAAAIRHAEQSYGPVARVSGTVGAVNYRVLRTEGRAVDETPFARSMNRLGFTTTYSAPTNRMIATRREP